MARQLQAVFFDIDDTLFSTSVFAEKARRNAVERVHDVVQEVADDRVGQRAERRVVVRVTPQHPVDVAPHGLQVAVWHKRQAVFAGAPGVELQHRQFHEQPVLVHRVHVRTEVIVVLGVRLVEVEPAIREPYPGEKPVVLTWLKPARLLLANGPRIQQPRLRKLAAVVF